MSKCIPLAEVKQHNSEEAGVWLVIHDDVYDVSNYLAEHPGGVDALLDYAGKDGTQAFEDVGHSQDARIVMTKFRIGHLPIDEQSVSRIEVKIGSWWKWAAIAAATALVVGFIIKKYKS